MVIFNLRGEKMNMNNIWHSVEDSRITKDDFLAVIEIPKGSKKKYELDKETGYMILDRILYTSTHYPANYGFIPKTLSEDDDPLDVLVLSSESLDTGTMVRCYPIGTVTMIDDGKSDAKIIAIPFKDPLYNEYKNINMLPKHVSTEMVHFLKVYKELENKVTEVKEMENADAARDAIQDAKLRYKLKYGSDRDNF